MARHTPFAIGGAHEPATGIDKCAGPVKPHGLRRLCSLATAPGLAHKGPRGRGTEQRMPSLIRFLVFCAVIAGLVYGAMFALTAYVEPTPREITIRVPTEKVNPD